MSATTIRNLIETLEEIAEQYGDDTVVLAAHQPNYPLCELLAGVAVLKVGEGNTLADDEICGEEGCWNDAVAESDDGDLVCEKHAEEFGVEYDKDEEFANVAFLALSGAPSEWSDTKWTSPYAPNVWEDGKGEFFNV